MTATDRPWTRIETYYAGAYWGARREVPEDCGRRIAKLLELLAPCDPFLAHWYKPTRSLKDERKFPLLPSDMPTLTEMFRRGVNREKGKPVIEQLGFSVTFGNGGGDYDRSALKILCGCYSEVVPNCCVLSLPTLGRSPNAERVISAPVLTHAVRSMAVAMEPDWAVAGSDSHRALEPEDTRAGPWVGWVTYFSKQRGTVPPLPAPVRIEPVEDQGTLIILTPERFTVANPEHLALARRVRELLARAGLIQPR
ncbi:immunity 52 family protein [Corallococcus sp. AS-1-12]|uniref:immunity 52 family protein n=1 Tax=Corallococcus sp. AS-1-12 TaxID=2874598 RepID=UPI00351D7EEA|nr:immunity 52 family protein [Corallococcus sp. AS-1-12]